MEKISLAVITNNSEKTLEQCLSSVTGLASEIVLVDDHSSDNTVQIARKGQAKIFERKLKSCADQKQYAIDQAANEWVFLLDSDEACSQELKAEIAQAVRGQDAPAAFRIPRRNYYFGQWLRYGGKFPDYQVRLYKKASVKYSDHFSHEKVIVRGETATLSGWIDHFAYPDLDTWLMKLKRTAEFDALEWQRKGIKPSPLNFLRLCILRPAWRFLSKYILKGGFLDGVSGLLAALHDVLTQILTYHILSRKSA